MKISCNSIPLSRTHVFEVQAVIPLSNEVFARDVSELGIFILELRVAKVFRTSRGKAVTIRTVNDSRGFAA